MRRNKVMGAVRAALFQWSRRLRRGLVCSGQVRFILVGRLSRGMSLFVEVCSVALWSGGLGLFRWDNMCLVKAVGVRYELVSSG